MKFGKYLENNKEPDWAEYYLQYGKLKHIIKDLQAKNLQSPGPDTKNVSLSVPAPTNAAGVAEEKSQSDVSQEAFFSLLESEMKKIEDFTLAKVQEIRTAIRKADQLVETAQREAPPGEAPDFRFATETIDAIAEEFLRLEKYVNLNFTGFHKILKKHDKRLPNPCKAFYIARMHERGWARGDYSDVIVSMSRIYSIIRGDRAVEEVQTEKQDFVRTTTKYWVHMENVSRVKYIVLQHLPVFLQKQMGGESDSQLVNSVYLDNAQLELYRGRLDKTPGAIALRFRWYGTGDPKLVFVERKTHRDSWTGEVSVKERFTIPENQVLSLLRGEFDLKGEIERMRAKGKSEQEIQEWEILATEVVQAINSKQLEPTMRTQYMRTAFQIPFDATVRISLDTNLCMILERGMTGEDRWYRDPSKPVPRTEITRFPHAVLEIKLQLKDASETPAWVLELQNSGLINEIHKFSKYIHGCAVLLPDDVQAVPYWIDDLSIRDSIIYSGAGKLLLDSEGANEVYNHLLTHDQAGRARGPRRQGRGGGHNYQQLSPMPYQASAAMAPVQQFVVDEEEEEETGLDRCFDWVAHVCSCTGSSPTMHISLQKVEPKVFFANERTFMHWLSMAVTLASIAVAILAFSGKNGPGQYYGLALLPVSLIFAGYALHVFLWRGEKIRTREPTRWDDPLGPVLLASTLALALTVNFIVKLYDFVTR